MKRVFSLVLATILLSQNANASVDSFLQGAITVDTTTPGYTASQTRGVFSLGEMKLATGDIGSIPFPVKITAPRFSAGCGGIDISLGGFQFLLDEMVQKFKKIASAAPAFAFQIALNFLCPECAEKMAQLQALADKLNNMNMDGCKGMQDLTDWTSNKLKESTAFKELHGGGTSTFSANITKWSSSQYSIQDELGGYAKDLYNNLVGSGADATKAKELTKIVVYKGSAIRNVMKENPNAYDLIGNAEESEAIVRAMAGDIIGASSMPVPVFISPVFTTEDLKVLINGNGDIHAISVAVNTVPNGPIEGDAEEPVNKIIHIDQGMKKYFEDKIFSILTKMTVSLQNNTPNALDASEKIFISSMPLPIYKILNTEAKKGFAVADTSSIKALAAVLASIQAKVILSKALGKIMYVVMDYSNKNASSIDLGPKEAVSGVNLISKGLRDNIDNLQKGLVAELQIDNAELANKMKLLEYYASMEKDIGAKMASNGIYSRRALGL